jgi:hypothetical protein
MKLDTVRVPTRPLCPRVAKWVKRFRAGVNGLRDRSSRPEAQDSPELTGLMRVVYGSGAFLAAIRR